MNRDSSAILDILHAARQAREFVAGLDLPGFLADPKTRSAALHQLMVLGEATKRLSEEFRKDHPELPWRRMAGMRDRLIHAVDHQAVWRTLEEEIPRVIEVLAPLGPPDPG